MILSNIRMKPKLILLFLLTGLIPLLVIGILSWTDARKALMKKSFEELEGVREIRKAELEEYFAERKIHMDVLVKIAERLQKDAFQKLKVAQELKKVQIEEFFSELQTDIRILSGSEDVLRLYEHLRKYHDDMNFGPARPYDISANEYNEIYDKYSGYLINYVKKHAYYDMFLICAPHGHVMFSATRESDLGTNLGYGKYKNEGLARLWHNVVETEKAAVEDFSPYAPSNGRQSAFIGAPVYGYSDRLLGLIAVRIPTGPINAIVQRLSGMGRTGETYLAGRRDGITSYRSDRKIGQGRIGEKISDPDIDKALDCKSGQEIRIGTTGDMEIISYDPLNIQGLNWAIISTISLEEAIAPGKTGEEADLLSEYVQKHNYQNLFLIHPQGRIFYSAIRGPEYGTNMVNGKYSDSGLGKLVKKVLKTKEFAMADFEPYGPDNDEPAAFIAQPVLYKGRTEIVVALQLSAKEISNIMHKRKNMGDTGETYLVGSDGLMRSDSYLDPVNHTVKASFADPDKGSVQTEGVRDALSGNSSKKIITNCNGNQVLSAYAPIRMGDATWALMAETDESEVRKSVRAILWNTLGLGCIAFIIIGIGAFLIGKEIANPLTKSADFAKSVAKGDLNADIDVTQKDEVGILANALREMKANITDVLKETGNLTRAVREGNLHTRGNADSFSGGWKDLVVSLNNLIDTFVSPINITAGYIDRISKGDIPEEITETYKGDFNEIKKNINILISNLNGTVHVAEMISKGNYSVEIEARSDKDRLSTALARMIRTLNDVTAVAEAVASGDYNQALRIRGENDMLGKAISRMTGNLRKMTDESITEDWLKTGQGELNEKMRGDQDLTMITQNILSYLAGYLNAQIGVFYLLEDLKSEKDRQFRLVSSFAYNKRNSICNTFLPGEGLIGQAALEKKSILFTNVPDDHVHLSISSGMGESVPASIFVLPLIHEQEVLGVLAVGASRSFNETETELLDRIAENVAISISSAQSRTRMKELLEQTQAQAEELQVQQEELKASNEELEEQTQLLRESEESLKTQKEELQAANEELEEKSQILEQQKADIEKKNAEIDISRQELRQKAEDLELASKYKSEFLANMSHELRTPLNSLLILAKMLAENEDGNLTPDQVESARVIRSGGQDLLNLINDILDLSKIEAGKMDIIIEDVALDSVIRDIRSQFAPVAKEKGLEFRTESADGLPRTLKTDEQRAEQIFRNLLSNAFKFTHKGHVSFKVGFPEPGAKFIYSDLIPGTAISFSIADTGIGISRDRQKAIFEAFQQADGSTSRKYGGTGLGLTISRELAKKLGGEIHMQSEQGKGSIFTLFLPLEEHVRAIEAPEKTEVPEVPEKAENERQEEMSDPGVSDLGESEFLPDDRNEIQEGDKTILVIEDDIRFARILMDFIRKKGYKFLGAGNGKNGLELAFEYKPSAIVLDIGLPDISGLKVLDNLKASLETRHIPVHVISAYDEITASLKKGAIGYLSKPAAPDSVNEVLAKLEKLSERTLKELLIIEDDADNQKSIISLLSNKGISITAAECGKDAYEKITTQRFDCVILDLGLPDMTGFELLEKLGTENPGESFELPPVIVYTGKELTREEHNELIRYAKTIVVKGANSPERLLDEVSLFLHTVESSLPDDQKKIIRMLHDPAQVLKGKKILLADDDLRNTFALSKVLGNYGLEVTLADNGLLALEKLSSEQGVDLVLMDIMMPVMDGYEAMQKIRAQAQYKKMPIIALTAKAMPEDRARCIEAGANDYLTKPVDENKLISVLKVWLFET